MNLSHHHQARRRLLAGLAGLLLALPAAADVGVYLATVVAMDGSYGLYDTRGAILDGSYRLPVEIEDDQVTRIVLPDGARLNVVGGVLHGPMATAMSYGGQRFRIEVTDDRFRREDTANDEVSDSPPDDG